MALIDHIDKLTHFKVVAEKGSFSQAARTLRLTQPTLSKSVQLLEGVLDTCLFTRTSRGVKLTEAGKVLFRLADTIISQCMQAEDEIRNPKAVVSGEVAVATYPPLAASVYPEIMSFTESRTPNLRIRFKTNSSTAVLMAWLTAREVDLIIVGKGSKIDPSFCYLPFKQASYGFFRRSVGKPTTVMTLRQLRAHRLVYMGDSFAGNRQTIADVLNDVGLSESGIVVDSHEIARGFALKNAGIAVLPGILADPYVKAGALSVVQVRGLRGKLGDHELIAVVRRSDLERRSLAFIVEHYLKC